ncbi:AraC family transcriptional regulator [Paenibacillus psychroresistens]|uniref:AraC family transcriptional regulator n=1 Tax=Paenibacillus psychroresistens TaxID=1778678 RepID=A0A6B8RI51_9BACL|nr:helix-turn-helix transcriptional regulator [Paenibacillus psychroresistens]QGQ95232.1 AraC family transcriptional regulator [Paenibacillus psychroresistens]
MSKRHFYRIFQQITGQTFTGYLQIKRIDQSCHLLRTTTRKIADISRDVGYKDSKFYSAVFKQLYGITPSSYRKLRKLGE